MKRLIGLALLAVAIAAGDAAESTPTDRAAPARATVPEPMVGCWENVSENGAREWLEIDARSVRGQFFGNPEFQTSKIGPVREAGSEGLVNIQIVVSARGGNASVNHELWMEEPNTLRISNYWGEGEAEPDPEFSRCSAENVGKPRLTR